MADFRKDRLAEYIKQHVSKYIARESNNTSLITITRVILSDSLKNGQILITVYPDDKKDDVIDFLRRHASDIRNYLKQNIRTRIIPFVEFIIDEGEKSRQRLDELSK